MPNKSKEISTIRATAVAVPVVPPSHLDRELRVALTRLDPPLEAGRTAYAISAQNAPSVAVREALALRKARLDECFAPAGIALVAEQLEMMMDAGMAMRSDEPGAASRWAVVAAKDLMDLPAFALAAACQDLRRGVIGDARWLPETGVIRSTASLKAHAFAKERREIHAVLTAEVKAPVQDADRRARNLADAAAFVAGARAMDAASRERRRDPNAERKAKVDAEALRMIVEDGACDARPMPKFGPALRAKYGIRQPDMVPDVAGKEDAAA